MRVTYINKHKNYCSHFKAGDVLEIKETEDSKPEYAMIAQIPLSSNWDTCFELIDLGPEDKLHNCDTFGWHGDSIPYCGKVAIKYENCYFENRDYDIDSLLSHFDFYSVKKVKAKLVVKK